MCHLNVLDVRSSGESFNSDSFGGISRSRVGIVDGSLNSKLPTIWRVEKQMKSR